MYTLKVLCALLVPHLVSAAVGNLTVTFYANDAAGTCGNAGEGVSLTTSDTPYAYTCFNLGDIFAGPNTTGYQLGNGAATIPNPDNSLDLGVNYTLSNLDSYNPAANYSQVSVTQVNLTSDQAGEGKPAGRFFKVYALPDCQQLRGQGDDPPADTPWFEQSCQTASGGDCHVVPTNIQSFSIQEDRTADESTCLNWAYLGAGSRSLEQSMRIVCGLAAVVALLVML